MPFLLTGGFPYRCEEDIRVSRNFVDFTPKQIALLEDLSVLLEEGPVTLRSLSIHAGISYAMAKKFIKKMQKAHFLTRIGRGLIQQLHLDVQRLKPPECTKSPDSLYKVSILKDTGTSAFASVPPFILNAINFCYRPNQPDPKVLPLRIAALISFEKRVIDKAIDVCYARSKSPKGDFTQGISSAFWKFLAVCRVWQKRYNNVITEGLPMNFPPEPTPEEIRAKMTPAMIADYERRKAITDVATAERIYNHDMAEALRVDTELTKRKREANVQESNIRTSLQHPVCKVGSPAN
jgi:hypothetical protein